MKPLKVRDLIERLQSADPNSPVVVVDLSGGFEDHVREPAVIEAEQTARQFLIVIETSEFEDVSYRDAG